MNQDKLFRSSLIGLVFLVLLTYSNHFNNSFHFDDTHCITDNAYIRSLNNIPKFFKTAEAFSSLPANQTYRPMLTTLYALDYSIGQFNVIWYHVPIFLFFLLQGFLMYLLIIKIFNVSWPNPLNKYFALFAVGWYMVSTANADTINYISSSSDSISTFWVVAGLVSYIYLNGWKKYLACIVSLIIGTLFKQSALVLPALLAVYAFLFEKTDNGLLKRIIHSAVVAIPFFILSAGLYLLQAKLTPPTYVTGGNTYNYIITQPFVILHYFQTFFLPIGLSADSDWVPLTSITSTRFMIGIAFLIVIDGVAVVLYNKPKYAPIAFGIAFFSIALLPATLVPLAEVMNDHRAFFAYIGIVIAATWVIRLVFEKAESDENFKKVLPGFMMLIILGNAVGTFMRNMVWHDEESLWHDVSVKSPENGRGLMNYGLALMAKGDYKGADDYYGRALKLLPDYSYLYENIAILKAAQGQKEEAENNFKRAIDLGPGVPVLYYYYAKYLREQGRDNDAIQMLKKSIELSPAEVNSRYMLMQVYQDEQDWPSLAQLANETLRVLPGDATAQGYLNNSSGKKSKIDIAIGEAKQHPSAENYIALSVLYYNSKDYDKCIDASQEAIKLSPDNSIAYNNLGSAYNMQGEWKKAKQAFEHALKLNPDFSLAKNNYALAVKQDAITDSMSAIAAKKPTPENYLNLSLTYYNQGLYMKAIEACKEAIKLNPNFTLAYNNMCAAYNKMGMWDDAISAGEKAVALDPNNQLAKNNLVVARQGKAQKTN